MKPFVMIDANLFSELDPYELTAYGWIKHRAGLKGTCWESQGNMVRHLKMSLTTLKRAIAGLLGRKMIIKTATRKGKTDMYSIPTEPSRETATEPSRETATNYIPLDQDQITNSIFSSAGEKEKSADAESLISNSPESSPLNPENEDTYLNTREGTLQTLLEQNQSINDYPLEQHSISCEEKDLPAARVTKVARLSPRDEHRARAASNSDLCRGIKNDRWNDLEDFKKFRAYAVQAAKDRETGITAGKAGTIHDENWVETVIRNTANCKDDQSHVLGIWRNWQMEIPPPPLFVATEEPKSEAPTPETMLKIQAMFKASRLRKEQAELDRFKYERGDECAE